MDSTEQNRSDVVEEDNLSDAFNAGGGTSDGVALASAAALEPSRHRDLKLEKEKQRKKDREKERRRLEKLGFDELREALCLVDPTIPRGGAGTAGEDVFDISDNNPNSRTRRKSGENNKSSSINSTPTRKRRSLSSAETSSLSVSAAFPGETPFDAGSSLEKEMKSRIDTLNRAREIILLMSREIHDMKQQQQLKHYQQQPDRRTRMNDYEKNSMSVMLPSFLQQQHQQQSYLPLATAGEESTDRTRSGRVYQVPQGGEEEEDGFRSTRGRSLVQQQGDQQEVNFHMPQAFPFASGGAVVTASPESYSYYHHHDHRQEAHQQGSSSSSTPWPADPSKAPPPTAHDTIHSTTTQHPQHQGKPVATTMMSDQHNEDTTGTAATRKNPAYAFTSSTYPPYSNRQPNVSSSSFSFPNAPPVIGGSGPPPGGPQATAAGKSAGGQNHEERQQRHLPSTSSSSSYHSRPRHEQHHYPPPAPQGAVPIYYSGGYIPPPFGPSVPPPDAAHASASLLAWKMDSPGPAGAYNNYGPPHHHHHHLAENAGDGPPQPAPTPSVPPDQQPHPAFYQFYYGDGGGGGGGGGEKPPPYHSRKHSAPAASSSTSSSGHLFKTEAVAPQHHSPWSEDKTSSTPRPLQHRRRVSLGTSFSSSSSGTIANHTRQDPHQQSSNKDQQEEPASHNALSECYNHDSGRHHGFRRDK
ncbi:hypothetical protein ACA910_017631 [Epithemia clementina (nom. ined.)]